MGRLARIFLFSTMLALTGQEAGAAGRRVALVIGVSSYEAVPSLPNATRDAASIAKMFKEAGFDVVTARNDVKFAEFRRAIREFEEAVVDSEVAVVFYAGHGIEVRDANYLIPSDAKLQSERDIEDETIPLDRVVNALEPAKKLRLVILDACRNNPFAAKMQRRQNTRAVSRGLARVEPAQADTLIAYAAKERTVANDGNGDNSPFTTALLKNLTQPGLDIRLAFGRVRDEVLQATNRSQEPYVYGSLGGGMVALVPSAPELLPKPEVGPSIAEAKRDYEIVAAVNKREAWEAFLNIHKAGIYAELARVELSKLGPVADLPSATQQALWNQLRASTDIAQIKSFIESGPESSLTRAARERLLALELLAQQREDLERAKRDAVAEQKREENEARVAAEERKRLEQEAARKGQEEERARALAAEKAKADAVAAAEKAEAEKRARIAEELVRQRQAAERAMAEEIEARRRRAEERARQLAEEQRKAQQEAARKDQEAADAERQAALARAAEGERRRAEAEAIAAKQRETEALKAAEALRRAAEIAAEVERKKLEAAAAANVKSQAEVESSTREQREAADAARRAKEAAAARQAAAAEAARLAAARKAEREAALREQNRAAANRARAAAAARPVEVRERPRPEIRQAAPRPSGGAMTVGIGF